MARSSAPAVPAQAGPVGTTRSPRAAQWAAFVAALVGAGTVAVAESSIAGAEVLELAGAAGPPWWRLRALVLGLTQALPIGSLSLRLGVAVALLHGALAALIAWRTTCALIANDERGALKVLAAPTGVLAAAIAVVSSIAFAAVASPSAAALGVVVVLLASEEEQPTQRAFFAGLLTAIDPVLAPIAWIRMLRGGVSGWRWALVGASPLLVWLTPSRALYTFPLSWPTLGIASETWATLRACGGVVLALATAGALLTLRARRERELVLEWLGALALAALFGTTLGGGAWLLFAAHTGQLVARAVWLGGGMLVGRVPLARTTLAMVLLLLCALPLARLDGSLAKERRVARAVVELQTWARLEANTLLLARDRAGERALLSAQLLGAVPKTIDVLPLRDITSTRAHEAIAIDPTLAPVIRETLLDDLPSEYVLSNLATMRPLVVEMPPSVPKPIAKHLVVQGLWTRFDPEPRGASDRAGALDRQKRIRAAQAEQLDEVPMLRPRILAASRRLALALAATGERESASRGIDQLRALAGDEPLVSLLVRKSVLGASKQELEELVHEE